MPGKIIKVVIIDDDEIYRFTSSLLLQKINADIQIIEFDDGEMALDYLRKIPGSNPDWPDIVLIDINMPLLDGWDFLELASVIENKPQHKPAFFMVSSSIDPRDKNRVNEYPGLNGYLEKPLEFEIMKKVIDTQSAI